MLLRRSLLVALLTSFPAVALLYQPSVATTAESIQVFSPARTYQLAQIELPKFLPSAQLDVTSIGLLDTPLVSIAYGYYRINQREKFAIALAKLDRYAQNRLLLRIAGTSNWQDVQAVENLIAEFLPQGDRNFFLDSIYYWMVQRLLEQNRVDEAASLVLTKMAHTDLSDSSNAFKNLVNAYLRQNRLREALEMIKQFDALQDRWLATKQLVRRNKDWQNENYQSLIGYYLAKQQYKNAFEIAQRLQSPNLLEGGENLKPSTDQMKALLKIAATCSDRCSNEGRQVRNQALKRVEMLAVQFEDVDDRVEYLAAVAMGYSKAGQKTKADQVFAQALQLVPKITSRFPDNVAGIQAQAIAEIASYQAGAGNLTQALKLTNQLAKEDENQTALLLGIANLYTRQGNQKRSAELYSRVMREGGKKAIRAVVRSYLEINKEQQAIQLIRQMQDSNDKQWELMQLSKFYQAKRNRTQALAFLNEAATLFPEKLDRDQYYQEYLLRNMLETVETYRKLNDLNGAEQLLDRILSLANQFSKTPSRRSAETDLQSAALYEVATAYAQLGKLAKAVTIVPTIRDLSVQDRARLEVVNSYLDANTPDQSLALARSIQKPEIQATAFTDTAHYFSRNQQPEKALSLLDAAFNLAQPTR
jgi:tetratricopeptide (TPR) repeat protein